jgi:hypothetical protein
MLGVPTCQTGSRGGTVAVDDKVDVSRAHSQPPQIAMSALELDIGSIRVPPTGRS